MLSPPDAIPRQRLPHVCVQIWICFNLVTSVFPWDLCRSDGARSERFFYLLLSCKMQITFRTTLLEATRLCGVGPESEITGFVRVNLTRTFRCIQKRLAHIDVTDEGCHESKVCLREKQRWERRILWCLRSPHTLQTLAKKTSHRLSWECNWWLSHWWWLEWAASIKPSSNSSSVDR